MSTVPTVFLTEEFLRTCLQDGVDDDVKVVRFEAGPAVDDDINFASIVLRVKTFFTKKGGEDVKEINLIVKFPPEKVGLNMADFFCRKEHNFYSKIEPNLSKYYSVDIFPKSLQCPNPSVVVMEDLTYLGYKSVNRTDSLDTDHCKLYFEAAAKMHAASIAMVEKDPAIIDSFGTGGNWLIDQDADMRQKFSILSTIGVRCLADLVRHVDDYKDIVEVLDAVADDSWALVVTAEKTKDCFKSFVQFDCYKMNMMFKYGKEGTVESVKLIDFQTYTYFPVVYDIINFIWRSTNHDVRESRLDELYQFYCDNLNRHLADFGRSETLSYQRLRHELDIFSPLVLHMVSFYLPYGQAKNPTDLNTLFGYSVQNPKKCYDCVKNMISQSPEIFPGILKHLKSQGVVDSLRKLHLKHLNRHQ